MEAGYALASIFFVKISSFVSMSKLMAEDPLISGIPFALTVRVGKAKINSNKRTVNLCFFCPIVASLLM